MRQEQYSKAMEATKYEVFASCFEQGCSRCTLSAHDNRPVLYRGNPKAPIVLIGEAPGAKEDKNGRPFSGPAGQLLDKIFHAIGMDTNEDMLLTNVVYCRPVAPKFSGRQNYTPKTEQTTCCFPFTRKALQLLQPKVIIACGRTALCALMNDDSCGIGQYEGKWEGNVFVMTHPAAILHQSNDPNRQRETKLKVWKYMQYFRDTYKERL